MKPKVFIGSSREGVTIAQAIHANLTRVAQCTVWKDGVFELTSGTLASLLKALQASDFGIFVFSPDDLVLMRGDQHRAVRDNVLFELGMFIGRLGPERSFFLVPDNESNLHLPSDLAGITPGEYEGGRDDDNWDAAVSPVCMKIAKQIKSLTSLPFKEQAEASAIKVSVPKASVSPAEASEDEEDEDGKMWLEPYKKSYLVKGATKPHAEKIKEFGGKWNGSLVAWVIGQSRKHDFEKKFHDLLK